MAAKLLEEHGLNELTPPKRDPWWLRFIKSVFGGFFNILLWFGYVLCFIARQELKVCYAILRYVILGDYTYTIIAPTGINTGTFNIDIGMVKYTYLILFNYLIWIIYYINRLSNC